MLDVNIPTSNIGSESLTVKTALYPYYKILGRRTATKRTKEHKTLEIAFCAFVPFEAIQSLLENLSRAGGVSLVFVEASDALNVVLGILIGVRAFGIPSFIQLNSLPHAEPLDVVFEDTDPEIDVVLNFKEVDALDDGLLPPGLQMDLHHSDRVRFGNREGVCPALDNHDARHEARIQIVFPAAVDDRTGHAAPIGPGDVVFLEEFLHRRHGGARNRDYAGRKDRSLGLIEIEVRENEGTRSLERESYDRKKHSKNQ